MMPELHPSFSAVGAHLDEEIEEAVHARQSHKDKEGRPTEERLQKSEPKDVELQTEEMMRLGQ